MDKAKGKIVLPVDVALGDKFDKDAQVKTVKVSDGVADGWRILDIGSVTVNQFAKEITGAKLIIWNGPMGVFEFPNFAKGTNAVAKLLAESGATTVIGGGESVAGC